MALNDKKYLQDNTIVNPEIFESPKRSREEIKKLQESKENYRRQNIRRNNKVRVNTILTLCFVAIICFFTIYRSSMIFSMQNEYLEMQSETKALKNENEALRSQMINASSLNEMISASEELDLVQLNKNEYLTLDLNKNNFKDIEEKIEEDNFIDKAMSFLTLKNFR